MSPWVPIGAFLLGLGLGSGTYPFLRWLTRPSMAEPKSNGYRTSFGRDLPPRHPMRERG